MYLHRPLPKFGQLEITVHSDSPRDILFELQDSENADNDRDGWVFVNRIPVGHSQDIANLTADLREHKVPAEDKFRSAVVDLIENGKLDQSSQKFKFQNLLSVRMRKFNNQLPWAFLQSLKSGVSEAAKNHQLVTSLQGTHSASLTGHQSLWLVPDELKKVDALFLRLVQLGCAQRNQ